MSKNKKQNQPQHRNLKKILDWVDKVRKEAERIEAERIEAEKENNNKKDQDIEIKRISREEKNIVEQIENQLSIGTWATMFFIMLMMSFMFVGIAYLGNGSLEISFLKLSLMAIIPCVITILIAYVIANSNKYRARHNIFALFQALVFTPFVIYILLPDGIYGNEFIFYSGWWIIGLAQYAGLNALLDKLTGLINRYNNFKRFYKARDEINSKYFDV